MLPCIFQVRRTNLSLSDDDDVTDVYVKHPPMLEFCMFTPEKDVFNLQLLYIAPD